MGSLGIVNFNMKCPGQCLELHLRKILPAGFHMEYYKVYGNFYYEPTSLVRLF